MSQPVEFIPNLIDENGRPLYLPVGLEIPEGAVQVSDEVFAKILAGESRYFRHTNGNIAVFTGYSAWAPTFDPGEGWTEVSYEDIKDELWDGF